MCESIRISIFGTSTWPKRTENQNKIYQHLTGIIFFRSQGLLTCSRWIRRTQINCGRWIAKNGLTTNSKKKKEKTTLLKIATTTRSVITTTVTPVYSLRRLTGRSKTANRAITKPRKFKQKLLWLQMHVTQSLFRLFKRLKSQRKVLTLDAPGCARSRTLQKIKTNEKITRIYFSFLPSFGSGYVYCIMKQLRIVSFLTVRSMLSSKQAWNKRYPLHHKLDIKGQE